MGESAPEYSPEEEADAAKAVEAAVTTPAQKSQNTYGRSGQYGGSGDYVAPVSLNIFG
jgi:hypothetical protein